MTNDCGPVLTHSNGGPPFLLCSCYVTRYTPLPYYLSFLPYFLLSFLSYFLPYFLSYFLSYFHPFIHTLPVIRRYHFPVLVKPVFLFFHQPRRFPQPSSRLFPGNRENHFPRTIPFSCFRHRQTRFTIRRQSASSIQSHGFRPPQI